MPQKLAKVAVAPPQFLYQLQKVPSQEIFNKGVSVGFVRHRGGYVREKGVDAYYRSKHIKIEEPERLQKRVKGWTADAVDEALDLREIPRVPMADFSPEIIPLPEQYRKFGEASEDGKDNVNNPYIYFRPAKVFKGELPTSARDANAVLIPIVVYAYLHNAGWFIGQEWGCTAGARFRILWLLYSVKDRSLLRWADMDTRVLPNNIFHPDRPTGEKIWLNVEARMKTALEESFQ